jgi:hypothetical protein
MALGVKASEIFQEKLSATATATMDKPKAQWNLRAKADQSAKTQDKTKKKKYPGPEPGYKLRNQPMAGRYSFVTMNAYNRRTKQSSIQFAAAVNYLDKVAGGPGSGDPDDNTVLIRELPLSKLISIGKRKEFMDGHKPTYTNYEVPLDKIKFVSQKKMVPKKVMRMLQNKEEVLDKPVDLLVDKNGNYHVMDGHHRYLVAHYDKRKTMKANVWSAKSLEKSAYILNPKAMKPKAPAKVTDQGVKKNLRPQFNQMGQMASTTLPQLKPFVDNDKYLSQWFYNNPFL